MRNSSMPRFVALWTALMFLLLLPSAGMSDPQQAATPQAGGSPQATGAPQQPAGPHQAATAQPAGITQQSGQSQAAPQPAQTPPPGPASATVPPGGPALRQPVGLSRPSTPPAGGTLQPVKRSYRPLPPPSNFSPPGIQCDNADYDWGTVLQGEKVRHDYAFANTGGSPLVIDRVQPGCGCTMAAKPDKPIAPGQTGIVTLEIDTKRFSGKISKSASVYSNAIPNPYKITIGGNVENFYTIEPAAPRINAVRGLPAEPVKITLKRNANAKASLAVKEVKTQSKIASATLTEVTPGEFYEITVGATIGEDQRKFFYENVTVGMDVNGKHLEDTFNVSITVKDRIDVQPRTTVYFSRNETKALSEANAQPVSKVVDIVSLGGPDHKFKITEVTAEAAAPTPPNPAQPTANPPPATTTRPSPYFDTKVETVAEGKHYRLLVNMSKLPGDNQRTLRESIVVRTDDPSVKELKITAIAAIY